MNSFSLAYNRRMIRPLYLTGLLAILLLSACQPQREAVTFMVFGDAAEFAAYRSLVDAFEATQPDIDVKLAHIPSPRDYRTRLATDFAAGTPPDVSLINYRRVPAFAAAGQLQPLAPYLEASDAIAADDFYPVALDAFRWRGELMCIPQNLSLIHI